MSKKTQRFVKLHRSFAEWGWYHDVPCRLLMLHLMLNVNWKEGEFMGDTIHPGQLATSLPKLSAAVGISDQQARTALTKLKSTGEITERATGTHRVITLVKWDFYQGDGSSATWSATDQVTDDQQTINRRGHSPANPIEELRTKNKEATPSGVAARGTIEDRRLKFIADCKAVIEANPDRLEKSERKAFTEYWTEADGKGHMRFEAEKFFDHARRMSTWQQRADKGEPQKSSTKPWVN